MATMSMKIRTPFKFFGENRKSITFLFWSCNFLNYDMWNQLFYNKHVLNFHFQKFNVHKNITCFR